MAPQLAHAEGFAAALAEVAGEDWAPSFAADLGSGGGVPALPLALRYDRCRWVMVESMALRASFLRDAVATRGIEDRVEVIGQRAEAVGRRPEIRGRLDLVTARGFGPPAVVAECAAPLLTVGGWAVVSEPPGGRPDRWPDAGLAALGLSSAATESAFGATYQVLQQRAPCP